MYSNSFQIVEWKKYATYLLNVTGKNWPNFNLTFVLLTCVLMKQKVWLKNIFLIYTAILIRLRTYNFFFNFKLIYSTFFTVLSLKIIRYVAFTSQCHDIFLSSKIYKKYVVDKIVVWHLIL